MFLPSRKYTRFLISTTSNILLQTPDKSKRVHTFINPPPADYAHLFEKLDVPERAIESVATDEIEAHMNMFDMRMETCYINMLIKTSEIISEVIRNSL
jgi:hypothetical protein